MSLHAGLSARDVGDGVMSELEWLATKNDNPKLANLAKRTSDFLRDAPGLLDVVEDQQQGSGIHSHSPGGGGDGAFSSPLEPSPIIVGLAQMDDNAIRGGDRQYGEEAVENDSDDEEEAENAAADEAAQVGRLDGWDEQA